MASHAESHQKSFKSSVCQKNHRTTSQRGFPHSNWDRQTTMCNYDTPYSIPSQTRELRDELLLVQVLSTVTLITSKFTSCNVSLLFAHAHTRGNDRKAQSVESPSGRKEATHETIHLASGDSPRRGPIVDKIKTPLDLRVRTLSRMRCQHP